MFSGRIPTEDLWRTYYGGSVDMMRIEQALLGANVGMMRPLTDLGREMVDRDPQISSLLLRRFGLLKTLPYTIEPAQGEGIDETRAKLYADVVRDQLGRIPGFRTRLFQLAWGQYDARAALEIQWEFGRKGVSRIQAKALGWIHPRRISYGPEREFRIVDSAYQTSYFPAIGEALRDYPYKFIEFRSQLFAEYPEREGLGPRCLYWAFFKRFGVRERMILAELFGKPWRIIEVDKDAGAQAEDLAAADRQIRNLGGAQTARLPKGAKLNVVSPGDNAGKVHDSILSHADEQMSKLILGNTNTTDAKPGGLGTGQADVHEGQQLIVHKNDASDIDEAIEDQLTDAIILLNFGPDALSHAPRFFLNVDPKTDKGMEIDRLAKIVQVGVPVSLAEAYERTGYRAPADDEPVLMVVQAPAQEGGAPSPIARAQVVHPSGKSPEPGEVTPSPGAGGPPELAADPQELPTDPQELPFARAEDDGDDEPIKTRAAYLGHGCEHVLFAAQPETVNGSPDDLITKGIRDGARETGKWAQRLAASCDGATTAGEILRALSDAAAHLNVQPFARVAERRMMHTAMLGALDSHWEASNQKPVAPETFAQTIPPGVAAEPSFVRKPYDAAVKWFKAKQVMDKATFEQLSARAKSRAFTIAGMAKDELLATAHAELARHIEVGADLKDFRKFVAERLESAGWTPANPSHVENIYRTNVMNAYSAGRHAEMTQPAVLKARPYWQVLGVDDARTRSTHLAAQGKVLAASDPYWQKAHPPFGFMCRDRVRSLSEADVKRLGLKISTAADMPRELPDKGFTSGTLALL